MHGLPNLKIDVSVFDCWLERRSLLFIVPLDTFMTVRCTEAGST